MVNRAKRNAKHPAKGIFSPSSHAVNTNEFVMGLIIGGLLGGIGGTLATIMIKGMIKKYVTNDQHFLRRGAE